MDKAAAINIVKRFGQSLRQMQVVNPRLILFGSQAKGTSHRESDIDIVVISETFAEKNLLDRIYIVADAITAVDEPIEAFPVTPEEWEKKELMITHYAKDGELIEC